MIISLQTLSFGTTLTAGLILWLAEGIIPFFVRKGTRGKHASVNLGIAAINLMILLPSGILTAWCLSQAAEHWQGISLPGIPAALHTVLILILIDLWMYFWHRINHENLFLWRFHSVHHSDPSLDVTSAWRFHFMEIMISEALRLSWLMLIGATIQEILFYSILMTPVIEFHHSNLKIPDHVDRILRTVITTPKMHRIHHSVLRTEHDSNYGSLLSLWDRLFGSFKNIAVDQNMQTGLAAESAPEQQTIEALLTRPFRT
jgi:sterol desaturase/sphingolipid hydroxylase (fatty acid hydroxylase superfamily)